MSIDIIVCGVAEILNHFKCHIFQMHPFVVFFFGSTFLVISSFLLVNCNGASFYKDCVRYGILLSRFHKIRDVLFSGLISLSLICSIGLIALVKVSNPLSSICSIGAHIADSFHNFELAEQLYFFGGNGSYILTKSHYNLSQDGIETDDARLDKIISKNYGPSGCGVSSRLFQVSDYYQTKGNFQAAKSKLLQVMAIQGVEEVEVKIKLYRLYVKSRQQKEAKTLMDSLMSVESMIRISKELKRGNCFAFHFLTDFADELNNIQMKKKLKEIGSVHKEHLQQLHRVNKFHFRVSTDLFTSLPVALLVDLLIFSCLFFPWVRRKTGELERELSFATIERKMEILQDLIALSVFNKKYDSVELHSKRFLELCQERN